MTPTASDVPQKPATGPGLCRRDDNALRDHFRVGLELKADKVGCITTLANLTAYTRQPRRVTVWLHTEDTAPCRPCGRYELGKQNSHSWPEHTWTSIVGLEGREVAGYPDDPQPLCSGGGKP